MRQTAFFLLATVSVCVGALQQPLKAVTWKFSPPHHTFSLLFFCLLHSVCIQLVILYLGQHPIALCTCLNNLVERQGKANKSTTPRTALSYTVYIAVIVSVDQLWPHDLICMMVIASATIITCRRCPLVVQVQVEGLVCRRI